MKITFFQPTFLYRNFRLPLKIKKRKIPLFVIVRNVGSWQKILQQIAIVKALAVWNGRRGHSFGCNDSILNWLRLLMSSTHCVSPRTCLEQPGVKGWIRSIASISFPVCSGEQYLEDKRVPLVALH